MDFNAFLVIALLAILTIAAPGAAAQVHRCPDNKGRVIYSDLPCDWQGAIAVGRSSARGSAQASWPTANGVRALLEAAAAESDPAKRQQLASDIGIAMAAYAADANGAAQRQAHTEAGVPVLEGHLEAARRADRLDPQWTPGIGDSPITSGVQEQLLKARQAADARIPQILATNVEYQRLQAAYASFNQRR